MFSLSCLRPKIGVLKGKSCHLRLLKKGELEQITSWFQDQELASLAFGLRADHPSFLHLVESYLAQLSRMQQNLLAIEAACGDPGFRGSEMIGFVSFFLEERGSERGTGRIGILIGKRECWNKGYGQEAVRLLLSYLFTRRGVKRVELDTADFNGRAQRCFTACGFRVDPQLAMKHAFLPGGSHRIWYSLSREQFFPRHVG